ncbi:hypothetical protein NM04_11815 [Massilia aurea]|uniref:Uncharacterized protein n=1 Tax=Massilia aurea TaxID=373040 RepID=A0A422QL89_9BURK|nr:hypothetical protein NM04_11815 [Massilia aurea]
MRLRHRVRQLANDIEYLIPRQPGRGQQLMQGFPSNQLHHDRLAVAVVFKRINLDESRMPQRCGQARLLQQVVRLIPHQVRLQALDGNGALQRRIPCLMHIAEAAIAKQLTEAIALGTGSGNQVRR